MNPKGSPKKSFNPQEGRKNKAQRKHRKRKNLKQQT